MNAGEAKQAYERYAEVTRFDYGAYIRRSSSVGAIDLIDLYQTPGDFSDRSSRDITIIRTLGRARFQTDFGAGKFTEWYERGGCVVNPPGFSNEILAEHHHRVEVLCVPWDLLVENDAEGLLPSDGDLGIVHAMVTTDAGMSAILDYLWDYSGPDAELVAGAAMASVTERLLSWKNQSKSSPPARRESLTPRQLARCKERLADAERNAATLSELAALCGLSASHFCRAFKAATGLPPHQYQIVRRIERARELLLNSSMPIAEVAAQVGYDDPAYFSRLFARETGCTPSGWRRRAA